MIRNALLLLALAVVLGSCGPQRRSGIETMVCPELARYDPAKAQSDAAAALKRNDRHLMGVYGYVPFVPSADDAEQGEEAGRIPLTRKRHTIEWIKGTSDAPRCPDLNDSAVKYAKIYNEVIMADRLDHS
jgi:hypothetical protein